MVDHRPCGSSLVRLFVPDHERGEGRGGDYDSFELTGSDEADKKFVDEETAVV